MRIFGTILLFILSTLLLPFCVLSADTDDAEKVVGVITEKSDTGDFIQVGDYSISGIMKVVIKDDGKADKIGSTKDLFIGALVIVNLTGRGEEGIWGASAVALILGTKQDKALADLSKDEQNNIRETQKAITENGEQVTKEVDEAEPETPPKGNLRLENGVWVN